MTIDLKDIDDAFYSFKIIKLGDNIDNDYYDHDHDELFYVTVYKPKQSKSFSAS